MVALRDVFAELRSVVSAGLARAIGGSEDSSVWRRANSMCGDDIRIVVMEIFL